MRLIDADALSRIVKLAWETSDSEDFEKSVFIAIATAPTIEERKKGKWTEKHHAYSDEENPIEEWQSCKCSECGRYDTRPYLYYFSEPRFCSWCGAKMEDTE